MSRRARRRIIAASAAVIVASLAVAVLLPSDSVPETSASLNEVLDVVDRGVATEARMLQASNTLEVVLPDGEVISARYEQGYAGDLTSRLLDSGATVVVDRETGTLWRRWVVQLLVWIVLIGAAVGAFMFATNRRRSASHVGRRERGSSTTFADVHGVDVAVDEVAEIVSYLRAPNRFSAAGATPPRGVLLYGPPGTGKTLIARAVAGEADVPFFALSGSSFVEMFVGVGAGRMRSAFKAARRAAPSIVFIDEVDAVGRSRGAGVGGGQDERDQTLNQLLIEMDGFSSDAGVVVIAATNRPDVLDPALLRPGRFDRHVEIAPPDVAGRLALLEHIARTKPIADEVELADVARRTPGFTGADLTNLVNEAAIRAARSDEAVITTEYLEAALERIISGPERSTGLLTEDDRDVVAHHEAGHAVAAAVLDTSDVHSVSIIRRGGSLGRTSLLPRRDEVLATQGHLEDQLVVLMAGRASELGRFGDVSTAAESDITAATVVATNMVTKYGMGERTGPRRVSEDLATSEAVEQDVCDLITRAQQQASVLLRTHQALVTKIASELAVAESLNATDMARLVGHLRPDRHRAESVSVSRRNE